MENQFLSRPQVDKDFDDFIRRIDNTLLFVVGSAGSGKTTYLRYIFDKYTNENIFEDLVFIPTSHLKNASSLDSLILKSIDKKRWNTLNKKKELNKNWLKKYSNKNILIILDGLDEVDIKFQQEILYKLKYYENYLNVKSKIIVSTRATTFNHLRKLGKNSLINHIRLELPTLNQEEVFEMINLRLRGVDKSFNEKLFMKLLDSVSNSMTSPLMINTLISLFLNYDIQDLKRFTQKELFNEKDILQTLVLGIWKKLQNKAQEIIRTLIIFDNLVSVEKLALLVDINEEDFLDAINELKNKGIVILTGNIISFSHKTLSETFKAFLEKDKGNKKASELNIYVDLNYVKKEDVIELLNTLNNTYIALGGDELIIRENELGNYECIKEYVTV